MQWQDFPFKNHEDSLYWESKVLMLKFLGWVMALRFQAAAPMSLADGDEWGVALLKQ